MLFESDNDILDNMIEIWVEERGRKSDTYIVGWDVDDETLKLHLKTIKKKRGCNGSIKQILKDNNSVKVMQLQGNVKDFVIAYLKENGINDDNIIIRI